MAQYANMTLPDVCDLLLDDYLLLLRDAFIARKLQSADGRERKIQLNQYTGGAGCGRAAQHLRAA